jgi:hypothetical protein
MILDLSPRDVELITEALQRAASRHEAMGNDTKGRFRWAHDDKAERMRKLRRELVSKAKEATPIRTDLKKLDAHVVRPAEYLDAPELTDQQLAAAKKRRPNR